jgi:uncharacterized protein YqjF (DUF2071 family)
MGGMIRTGPTAFLTAEWRHLALINFEAPPALLEPLVPAGTELDRDRGRVFVSLVGFRFLDTRIIGCRIPGHVDFDEINLRFYVRREHRGEVRRAVTFIREIVPRRAIAALARAAYNEPYVALPMRSEITNRDADASTRVVYGWRSQGIEHRFELRARGVETVPAPGSHEHFITEHYWGYTRQRDGRTIEYQVAHPSWRLRPAASSEVSGELAAFYGPAFGEVLSARPVSAFLAEGSAVTVSRPVRIT